MFVCFVCAAIIISGSGYSISTTGFLSKILDPLVREFQETELASNKWSFWASWLHRYVSQMTKCILEIQVQKYKRWLFNLKDVIIFLNPSLQFGSLNASGLIKLCHQEVYRTTVTKEKVNLWGWAAGAQMYTNTGTHFSLHFQMNHQTKLSGHSGLGLFYWLFFCFLVILGVF